jgi:hypothetical protein
MGSFSSDESVKNYANKIWKIEPCLIDKDELEKIHADFEDADRCNI